MSLRPISRKLQELATKELHEDPKKIPDDLKYIKEWLTKQPHITARTDDQFLIAFLRGCKYSLERTKEKLDMYHTLKSITPELYENRDPLAPEIQKILSLGVVFPLSKLPSEAGPRYCMIRNGLVNQNKLDQADVFKVNTMIQDVLMMEDDNFTIAGTIFVQDMADISLSYALSISPILIKKAMTCLQQAYPHRIKEGHFFNVTSVFETIYKLFKPFLTEKLQKRMRVHLSIENFYKHVPKEVLPEEYGGEGGKVDDIVAYWKAKLESYRDWFLDDAKYKTDEKKRPGKPKTSESVFGLDGSFRQLSVD